MKKDIVEIDGEVVEEIKEYDDQLETEKIEEDEEAYQQMIIFSLDNGWYGLKIEEIKVILKIRTITPIPATPDYLVGIIAYRATIIPVLNIKKIFGIKESPPTDEARIIIMEVTGVTTGIGIVVDSVLDIQNIALSQISPPIATIERIKSQYIEGEFKCGENLVALLNLKDFPTEVMGKKR